MFIHQVILVMLFYSYEFPAFCESIPLLKWIPGTVLQTGWLPAVMKLLSEVKGRLTISITVASRFYFQNFIFNLVRSFSVKFQKNNLTNFLKTCICIYVCNDYLYIFYIDQGLLN